MEAEEVKKLSGGDDKVAEPSGSSFGAKIDVAVTDIQSQADDVDNLGMDCSVNDVSIAPVEPSNNSTASAQQCIVAMSSEDAPTSTGEGELLSEDVGTIADRHIIPSHQEQGEKEAATTTVEPTVASGDGHAVDKDVAADNELRKSTVVVHGEAEREPPTAPRAGPETEEDAEQHEKYGEGAPSSTEEGPSYDLRKVGAICGPTWRTPLSSGLGHYDTSMLTAARQARMRICIPSNAPHDCSYRKVFLGMPALELIIGNFFASKTDESLILECPCLRCSTMKGMIFFK